jgi:hypothetical protein
MLKFFRSTAFILFLIGYECPSYAQRVNSLERTGSLSGFQEFPTSTIVISTCSLGPINNRVIIRAPDNFMRFNQNSKLDSIMASAGTVVRSVNNTARDTQVEIIVDCKPLKDGDKGGFFIGLLSVGLRYDSEAISRYLSLESIKNNNEMQNKIRIVDDQIVSTKIRIDNIYRSIQFAL